MLNSVAATALVLASLAAGAASAEETPLERGTYLMRSMVACGNCHTPRGADGVSIAGKELAGQKVFESEAMVAYAPNITPDTETGIGSWTDEQIIKAIREGFRPDGTIIGPPMPIEVYRHMSDNDAKAIVAYLRSVPPVNNETPASIYKFPLPPTYGPHVDSVADVPRDDKVEYGEYLVQISHCMACHSPLVNGGPDIVNQMGAGGQPIPGPWGLPVSANITPHEDGLKDWSEADIKNAITRGIKPDGVKLSPPMPYDYYANITPEDLDAIVAYLRTVPPKPTPR